MILWGQPDGPRSSRLLVVGRDYGYHEIAHKPEPCGFVGAAGWYLNRALLETAGLPRSLVRVTNVANTRPAADKWEAHMPGAVERGMAELHTELARFAEVGGQLILALGEQALQACVRGDPLFKPKKGETITETRGYLFPSIVGVPVLAAVHPAAFLHGGWIPDYPLFRRDVAKAGRFLAGEYRPDSRERAEQFATTTDELFAFIEQAKAAPMVALDIEENRCLAFAWTPELGVAVPDYCREPWRSAVQELLDSAWGTVTQNGQYDFWRLAEYGFEKPDRAWSADIMLMWHAQEPLLAGKRGNGGQRTEKSLRFLASILTWEPFWKDYGFASPEEEWTLNAKDARVTLEIFQALGTFPSLMQH